MTGKRFQDALKKGLITLTLFSSSFLNPIKAQENYTPKYNTLAHKALEIQNQSGEIPHYYNFTRKKLDNIINNSKKKIIQKSVYTKTDIEKISKILNENIKKNIPEITKDSTRILPQIRTINPEQIYLLNYLALGKVNNLHFYPIKNKQGKPLILYDRDGTHNFSNIKDPHNFKDLIINPLTGEVQNIQKTKEFSSLKEISENEILEISKKIRDKKLSIKNYTPKYNTIAHQMLQIEDSVLIPFPSYRTLDLLINDSKKYIEHKEKYSKEELEKIVKHIDSDILEKIPSLKVDSLGRSSFQIKGNENCYRRSIIYLAIGQENNIPFYAFPLTGHLAIRYDLDGKHDALNPNNPVNKGDINIETTKGEIQKAFEYSDEFYRKKNILEKKYLEKNILLRNMTKDQLLADAYISRILPYYLRTIGTESEENVPYEIVHPSQRVIQDCNKAIKLSPDQARNYYLKGEFETMINGPTYNPEKALEDFNKALELNENPNYFYDKIIALSLIKNKRDLTASEEDYYDKEIFNTSNQALNLIKRLRNEFQLEKLKWGEDLQNYRLWKVEKEMVRERKYYFESKNDFVSLKKEQEKLDYLTFKHKYAKLNMDFFMFGLDSNF